MPSHPPTTLHETAPRPLHGVLLCQVGDVRLAFLAQDVKGIVSIEQASSSASLRRLMGLEPQSGRAMVGGDGQLVAVDSLNVQSEWLPLIPAPKMLTHPWGGALAGFVQADERLWPVYQLPVLARYLHATAVL